MDAVSATATIAYNPPLILVCSWVLRGVRLRVRSGFRILDFVSQGAGGRAPFLQQAESHSQQCRSEEDANEAKGQRAAHHAEENQDEWHVAALADEPRLDEVVNVGDAHT